MILTLDVGNGQVYGGLFVDGEIKLRFRKITQHGLTSDEMGVFLRSVLRENGFNHQDVTQIAFCTVVPQVVYSLKNACSKYFNLSPFELGPGVKTGLMIKYRNPLEVGADRIANAVSAVSKYPDRNLIVIDLGTATTFCAISKKREYLGGTIIAGIKISMEALEGKTAKLPMVEIVRSEKAVGRSTVESIQAGLFYGHMGAMKEIIQRINSEYFCDEPAYVIGTGGLSSLFSGLDIFDNIESDLVLYGVYESLQKNLK
jgi:type III pantothenate kinase